MLRGSLVSSQSDLYPQSENVVLNSVVRPGLWLSVLAVVVFICWAAWAEIDEVTRGEGRVVPYSRLQKIQSLEGGIIDEILVKEGQLVEAGQILAKLDNTRFYSSYMEGRGQSVALKAAIARLSAEVSGLDEILFPDDVDSTSPEAEAEQSLFYARRDKKNQAIDALENEINISKRQMDLIEPLVKKNAVSEIEYLRLKKELASLQGRVIEISNAYLQDSYAELASKKSELNALESILIQREDQFQRTELVSPVRGMVNDIIVTTQGGVVQPGEAIMEVLPIDDQLLIEAKVKPKDVAFLVPGMPSRVKVTAYDYTIYGDLKGSLIQISADTIEEDTVRGKEYYYQILVRTEENHLNKNGKTFPIKPGMIAEVDVIGERRTVLSYLLKPLIKAKLY